MLRHVLGLLSVLVLCASDARAQLREVAPSSSAQVAIGAAPAESWKTAIAGGEVSSSQMRTVAPDGSMVVSNRATGVKLTGFSMRGPIPGSTAGGFETDFSPGVTRIAFDPMKIDVVWPGLSDKGMPLPPRLGAVSLGKVSFTLSPPARAISDWVKGYFEGRPSKRDVTVTVRGTATRTISLKGCMPTSYTSNGSSAVVVLVMDGIALGGTAHPAAVAWINAALANPAASTHRRDVRFLYQEGLKETGRSTMKNGLPYAIGFTALDRASSAPVEEWIDFVPDGVDTLP